MASFEEINYNIRVNKSIERKMLSEVIQKLHYLTDLDNYRYIGMGSTYFTDFVLFHKYLGINKMISIEKEESKSSRFDFNKPFSCVDIKYGTTTTILPNLELDRHLNIIWLDYDGVIEDYIFSDLDSIVATSSPGTLFLISVNVEPGFGKKEERMQSLIDRIGKQRIPVEYSNANLNQTIYPKLVYEMIDRQIKKTLLERTKGNNKVLDYKQLFHYIYKDGVPMLTVGGVLFNEDQVKQINKMKFEDIKHVSSNATPYKITCPNLTYKEVHHLNKLLPCELQLNKQGNITNKEFKNIPLNHTDIKNFAEIYRYYPNFAEINF